MCAGQRRARVRMGFRVTVQVGAVSAGTSVL